MRRNYKQVGTGSSVVSSECVRGGEKEKERGRGEREGGRKREREREREREMQRCVCVLSVLAGIQVDIIGETAYLN